MNRLSRRIGPSTTKIMRSAPTNNYCFCQRRHYSSKARRFSAVYSWVGFLTPSPICRLGFVSSRCSTYRFSIWAKLVWKGDDVENSIFSFVQAGVPIHNSQREANIAQGLQMARWRIVNSIAPCSDADVYIQRF